MGKKGVHRRHHVLSGDVSELPGYLVHDTWDTPLKTSENEPLLLRKVCHILQVTGKPWSPVWSSSLTYKMLNSNLEETKHEWTGVGDWNGFGFGFGQWRIKDFTKIFSWVTENDGKIDRLSGQKVLCYIWTDKRIFTVYDNLIDHRPCEINYVLDGWMKKKVTKESTVPMGVVLSYPIPLKQIILHFT